MNGNLGMVVKAVLRVTIGPIIIMAPFYLVYLLWEGLQKRNWGLVATYVVVVSLAAFAWWKLRVRNWSDARVVDKCGNCNEERPLKPYRFEHEETTRFVNVCQPCVKKAKAEGWYAFELNPDTCKPADFELRNKMLDILAASAGKAGASGEGAMKMTESRKQQIDSFPYEKLLEIYHSPIRDNPWVDGEAGVYLLQRMETLRALAEPTNLQLKATIAAAMKALEFQGDRAVKAEAELAGIMREQEGRELTK